MRSAANDGSVFGLFIILWPDGARGVPPARHRQNEGVLLLSICPAVTLNIALDVSHACFIFGNLLPARVMAAIIV